MSMEELEDRRAQLLQELAAVGDLRPGSLVSRYRKCGKPNCRCAREGDPGHGPSWSRHVDGKTVTRILKPDEVERVQMRIAECQRLRRLTNELIEVSEALCEAQEGTETKKSLRKRRRGGNLVRGRTPDRRYASRQYRHGSCRDGAEAKNAGKGSSRTGTDADKSDHVGSSLPCGCGGGNAHYLGRRSKRFTTALGELRRAHCGAPGSVRGTVPLAWKKPRPLPCA